jgi:hypothetical protein
MIGHQREHDTCSGVELVLAALLSQAYAAFSKVRSIPSDAFMSIIAHRVTSASLQVVVLSANMLLYRIPF